MLRKDNFFKNYSTNLSKYNINLKKTKKIFNSFLVDLKNNQIPLLESYEKNYEFSFSKAMVKKFSRYKNIIVIGKKDICIIEIIGVFQLDKDIPTSGIIKF